MKNMKFIKSVLVAISLLLLVSCGLVVIPFPSIEKRGDLEEKMVKDSDHFLTIDKILIIDISGTISLSEKKGLFGKESTVVEVKDSLDKALDDPEIKAVILRINTPGGEITATDIIYNEIMNFKQKRLEKKQRVVVVAALMDLAASGGFYIAQSADQIYSHNTTILGNIGVIAVFPKIQGLASKIGFESRVIKSGPMKDMGSPFRDFTPEESKILNDIIQTEYSRFVDVVAANRYNLTREQVLKLADGRVYSAPEALKVGLIDGVMYLDQMINRTKALAGIKDAMVVEYKRPGEYKSNYYSMFNKPPVEQYNMNMLNISLNGTEEFTSPKFLYLWQP